MGHQNRERKLSKNHIKAISSANKGNTYRKGIKHTNKSRQKMSLAHKDIPLSEKHKLSLSLSKFKHDPDYEYCDEWKSREYKKDLRKDYCENIDCKGHYKKLLDHHIDLNKKHCKPSNIMTLCVPCSSTLHWKLGRGTNHKDYLTIIRKDRITYIHKKTRKKIILERICEGE